MCKGGAQAPQGGIPSPSDSIDMALPLETAQNASSCDLLQEESCTQV